MIEFSEIMNNVPEKSSAIKRFNWVWLWGERREFNTRRSTSMHDAATMAGFIRIVKALVLLA
jgi:hypothetical protein